MATFNKTTRITNWAPTLECLHLYKLAEIKLLVMIILCNDEMLGSILVINSLEPKKIDALILQNKT
jgi:hypothetical protein